MSARVVVIDNYDSFVYNLVQYLGELGAEPVVVRNDAFSVDGINFGFTAEGRVSLAGAKISGSIICDGRDERQHSVLRAATRIS